MTLLAQGVLRELVAQRRLGDAQRLGCLGNVALRLLHGRLDEIGLDVVENVPQADTRLSALHLLPVLLEECRERAAPSLKREKADRAVREFVRAVMARARVNHEAVKAPAAPR